MKYIDNKIINYLKEGKTQAEISKLLRQENIYPSSTSTVEKRIAYLKDEHEATGMFDLALKLRDLELV